jgi:TatD DNase family protein
MTENLHIVDSHCHLDFDVFDGEHDAVVQRAVDAGVRRMVSICTKLRELPQVQAIAEAHAPVFFAAGTHPMHVAAEPMVTLDELLDLTKHPKMIGLGETGLDYHYTAETKDAQKQSLGVHIEAARLSGLPLIIHARDADDDMANILTSEYRNGAFNCVMHCFSSSAELAKAALDLGFYLSMSGIATFKKSHELREIFTAAPVDHVLVETDSPFLAPQPKRGKRNEPAYTAMTVEIGAEIYGLSMAEFAAQTTANFDRLFSKSAKWQAA